VNNPVYDAFVEDTKFDFDRGFYDAPVNVNITCATPDAEIHYTFDGTDPTIYSPKCTAPIHVNSTTTLRAAAFKPGWRPSNIDTQTYLFVNDVRTQSLNGVSPWPEWPAGHVNGQHLNYGMDTEIVNDDSRYDDLIDDALLAIPTLSIVTDLNNLFSPATGIYVNATQDGELWERPISLELINPDGSKGFQIDAGLRIRGAWSRHSANPKHSFRMFFRDEYGKL